MGTTPGGTGGRCGHGRLPSLTSRPRSAGDPFEWTRFRVGPTGVAVVKVPLRGQYFTTGLSLTSAVSSRRAPNSPSPPTPTGQGPSGRRGGGGPTESDPETPRDSERDFETSCRVWGAPGSQDGRDRLGSWDTRAGDGLGTRRPGLLVTGGGGGVGRDGESGRARGLEPESPGRIGEVPPPRTPGRAEIRASKFQVPGLEEGPNLLDPRVGGSVEMGSGTGTRD